MHKLLLATTALLALSAAPASAVTFDFQDHTGLQLSTQTFGTGLNIISASGFTALDAPTALFVKSGGGDENGLGLHNDPTGDNEIGFGKGFVQINVDSLLLQNFANFSFMMGSTTQNEGWKVFGSDDLHPFQFTLLASSTDPGGQEGSHNLAGGYDNYSFFYSGSDVGQCGSGCGANVLLESITATAAVPEPSTWAMMLLGFAGIVTMGAAKRRRDGKAFRFA